MLGARYNCMKKEIAAAQFRPVTMVTGHFNPYSAGIDCSRQIPTSVDVRF